MKQAFKNTLYLFIVLCTIIACSKDDGNNTEEQTTTEEETPTITAANITGAIDENTANGTTIATINATVQNTNEPMAYTITTQIPAGAVSLNGNTLEITDETLFNYETHTQVTGQISITAGELTKTIDFTITINNLEEAFITTWLTNTPNEEITIYTYDSFPSYNYSVDWGDGTTTGNTNGITGDISHVYSEAGAYTVSITGEFFGIFNRGDGSPEAKENAGKLRTIENWGDMPWKTMFHAFNGCTRLVIKDDNAPDLSDVKSLAYMFQDATLFNRDLSHWNVSNIQAMQFMFHNATAFNQDLSGWNTENVVYCEDFALNSGITNSNYLPTAGDCF